MNLERIEHLTAMLKGLHGFKFTVSERGSISIAAVWLAEATSKALCVELNAAIGPLIQNLENELRKQLALCAKIKD